jgi:class III poly(R)-hydroxyalkanoic acid synthase PhaE subunit
MDQDDKRQASPDAQFADWMKAATDFWRSAGKTWETGALKVPTGVEGSPRDHSGRIQEAWQGLLRTWQTSAASLSSLQTMEATLRGVNTLPEAAIKVVRSTWDGHFKLYQIWMKNLGKAGEAGKAYSFEGIEPEPFKEWTAFYESEIQPILGMPQVGLIRSYQERANEALDKCNRAQVAIAEFLHLLSLPVEKSVGVMQEKLEEQAKEGKLSENFKDYYNMWIKILEGHYMNLYQSPEYVQSMGTTLNAVKEFKEAQEEVLIDMLQSLPIPTNKDMDQLYKEFYVLKKTVKAMAKTVKKLEAQT